MTTHDTAAPTLTAEQVEIAAEALYLDRFARRGEKPSYPWGDPHWPKETWDHIRADARAVLSAPAGPRDLIECTYCGWTGGEHEQETVGGVPRCPECETSSWSAMRTAETAAPREEVAVSWEFERYPALCGWMQRFASIGMAMNMIEWQKFNEDLDAALRQAKADPSAATPREGGAVLWRYRRRGEERWRIALTKEYADVIRAQADWEVEDLAPVAHPHPARPGAEAAEPRYLIRKGRFYYRPNRCGYTEFKERAGRYTKAEAEAEAAIEPGHIVAVAENDPSAVDFTGISAHPAPADAGAARVKIDVEVLQGAIALLEHHAPKGDCDEYTATLSALLAALAAGRDAGERS